jgi:hypothetical protein
MALGELKRLTLGIEKPSADLSLGSIGADSTAAFGFSA